MRQRPAIPKNQAARKCSHIGFMVCGPINMRRRSARFAWVEVLLSKIYNVMYRVRIDKNMHTRIGACLCARTRTHLHKKGLGQPHERTHIQHNTDTYTHKYDVAE